MLFSYSIIYKNHFIHAKTAHKQAPSPHTSQRYEKASEKYQVYLDIFRSERKYIRGSPQISLCCTLCAVCFCPVGWRGSLLPGCRVRKNAGRLSGQQKCMILFCWQHKLCYFCTEYAVNWGSCDLPVADAKTVDGIGLYNTEHYE